MKTATRTKTAPTPSRKTVTERKMAAARTTAAGTGKDGKRLRLPDGSRSVQSPWVWRGFLFMSLIALGLCISFLGARSSFYPAAWGAISAGWFGISMWLWRRHVVDDDQVWRARRGSSQAT